MNHHQTLVIEEHRAALLPGSALSVQQGEHVLHQYGKFIDIQFPSPRTAGRWELVSKGWVGVLRIDSERSIVIQPKISIRNLGLMLARAYDIRLETFPGLLEAGTLAELFDQLAAIMARLAIRVLNDGPHQAYQPARRRLTAVRGRLDIARMGGKPPAADIPCHFSERTADLIENRIPLWTAERILRSGLCTDKTQTEVREAFRRYQGLASLVEVSGSDCVAIRYDRMSERYKPLHAVCQLLLDGTSPAAAAGSVHTVPFLIHMPSLFERFVALWMMSELDPGVRVEPQVRAAVGDTSEISYFIDTVIHARASGHPICVLDTKYKDHTVPAAGDVAQVAFYALTKGCDLAGLVYPVGMPGGWQGKSGEVRAFRVTFDLSKDLAEAGADFRRSMMARIGSVLVRSVN